jgi:putative nucleotidyltransferase with HDIG domain
MLGTLDSLVNALEARSSHFSGHSQGVADRAERIARAVGVSDEEVHFIHSAGLLHDIGMIAVPDSVVQKPGALDRRETELIREHCRTGARILEPMTHLGPAITYVLEHHERLDGSGYPEGKRGDEISVGGQIVGLAEAWTALLEERTYRDRMPEADARATLSAASGSWFADDLVKALFRVEGR